ncbi:MAG: nucleoside/nucleotide kinase family protein [Micromonosporaceae bacterium]
MIISGVPEAVARAGALAATGQRRILGIAGPPGAGKSTLAGALTEALGERAVYVPMDGFHLAQAELARLGSADRKGAPDTFDVAGYLALLRRLRSTETCVYAPEFRREIEEPIAGAIAVPVEVPLVVTEGNYLLVSGGDWGAVAGLLDETWYVDSDDATRMARLVARHVASGKSPDDVTAWAYGSDQHNAAVVAADRDRADAVVRLEP